MQKHHVEEIVTLQHENAHLREAHRSQQPEANLLGGGEVESTMVDLSWATNISVSLDTFPLSFNTLRR